MASLHPLAGRPQSPEHIRRRVASVARTKSLWTRERLDEFRRRVSLANPQRSAEARRKNAEAHRGRTPWNKGNNWRLSLKPEEVRARNAAWARARRSRSVQRRINESISAQIYQALREHKAGRRWERLVGYTVVDLVKHLEGHLLPGMSMDNYGEWHIDHVRPRAAFRYSTPDDPAFLECWSLQNLRPLWAADNLRKGARLVA